MDADGGRKRDVGWRPAGRGEGADTWSQRRLVRDASDWRVQERHRRAEEHGGVHVQSLSRFCSSFGPPLRSAQTRDVQQSPSGLSCVSPRRNKAPHFLTQH